MGSTSTGRVLRGVYQYRESFEGDLLVQGVLRGIYWYRESFEGDLLVQGEF